MKEIKFNLYTAAVLLPLPMHAHGQEYVLPLIGLIITAGNLIAFAVLAIIRLRRHRVAGLGRTFLLFLLFACVQIVSFIPLWWVTSNAMASPAHYLAVSWLVSFALACLPYHFLLLRWSR